MKRTTPTARLLTRTLGVLTLSALALTACSDGKSTTTPTVQLPPLISVTSVKGDVKSQLMAAIYAQVLEDGGFRVARKDPVEMDRAAYYQAIQDGQFQLIPDSTGDLLSFVYSQSGSTPTTTTPTGSSGPATTQAPIIVTTTTEAPTTTQTPITVAGTDAASTTAASTTTADTTGNSTVSSARKPSTTPTTTTTVDATTTTGTDTVTTDSLVIAPAPTDTSGGEITTTTAAPGNGRSPTEQVVLINAGMPDTLLINNGTAAEDKTVIACTATAMKDNAGFQLITYTNLASIAPGITLGGSAEYLNDTALGYPAFLQYYGGEFKKTVTVEDADLADAIKNKTADCFAMNSLNPLITTQQMTILSDDRTLVPSNAMVALMASTVATPEAVAALDAIAGSLTTERLNQMLNEINANGTPVATVAAAFLASI